jgi:hypothetical protein
LGLVQLTPIAAVAAAAPVPMPDPTPLLTLVGAVLPENAVLGVLENVGLHPAPAPPAVLLVPSEDVLAASENAARDGA